jgi:rhodanese-related sulfurtransferase
MSLRIDRKQAQELLTRGAQLVEVLPAEEYEEGHLPGAINIPLKKLNKQSAARLDHRRAVITYCSDYQ